MVISTDACSAVLSKCSGPPSGVRTLGVSGVEFESGAPPPSGVVSAAGQVLSRCLRTYPPFVYHDKPH